MAYLNAARIAKEAEEVPFCNYQLQQAMQELQGATEDLRRMSLPELVEDLTQVMQLCQLRYVVACACGLDTSHIAIATAGTELQATLEKIKAAVQAPDARYPGFKWTAAWLGGFVDASVDRTKAQVQI